MAGTDLGGVPETTLWTLRNRAEEAARPGTYLPDPEAVRLYDLLREEHAEDFDRFGRPSQTHALRALAVDRIIEDFLAEHPAAPVVAVQRRLLPEEPGITRIPRSALDRAWLDEVPTGPAMVTAEGLFMIFSISASNCS